MNWTTKIEDGLGILHMRTQTDDEQAFRAALTPRHGFALMLREISPTEFAIACVPTADAAASDTTLPPATAQSLSPEDYEVLAAQNGVEVTKQDRPVDVQHKVLKAMKR